MNDETWNITADTLGMPLDLREPHHIHIHTGHPPTDEHRAHLEHALAVVAATPRHNYHLDTDTAAALTAVLNDDSLPRRVFATVDDLTTTGKVWPSVADRVLADGWPPRNLTIGDPRA